MSNQAQGQNAFRKPRTVAIGYRFNLIGEVSTACVSGRVSNASGGNRHMHPSAHADGTDFVAPQVVITCGSVTTRRISSQQTARFPPTKSLPACLLKY